MRKNPIIALAQIKYFEYGTDNVAKIKEYINLAKEKNADIVCFPESCIHKYDLVDYNHKLIRDIKEECEKNSIWAIVSDTILIRNRMYKSAMLIDRKGQLIGDYRKIKLYGDTEGVVPGKKVKVFDTNFGKIGIAICWDLAFPELFNEMKKKVQRLFFVLPNGLMNLRYMPHKSIKKSKGKEKF